MFVLDTDHLVILQKRSGADFANLLRRLSQYEPSAFFVTIVSFHVISAGRPGISNVLASRHPRRERNGVRGRKPVTVPFSSR
jgi:hypothetical protein